MHIDEIIEERSFGSSNKTVYVCWTSRPIWAWEGQLGLAVTMQDAGVSGAGRRATSFVAKCFQCTVKVPSIRLGKSLFVFTAKCHLLYCQLLSACF